MKFCVKRKSDLTLVSCQQRYFVRKVGIPQGKQFTYKVCPPLFQGVAVKWESRRHGPSTLKEDVGWLTEFALNLGQKVTDILFHRHVGPDREDASVAR